MKLYKLTDENGRTHNQTQWGEGVTHTSTGNGGLCSDGVIHAYEDPLVAVFMNPIHADFRPPQLWEAEGEPTHREGELKCGCRSLTTVKKIPLPVISPEQRAEIAIRIALRLSPPQWWIVWAERWLSSKDRTEAESRAATRVGARTATEWAAARAAARAAAWTVAWDARAAARAAEAAAWAAEAAEAAEAGLPLASIISEVLRV